MKRPAFQFYPADWRKDAELQSCSVTARGLWHEAICIMHECEPYGELRVNGKPMSTEQLARLVGMSLAECKRALAEIEDAGVSSRTEDGALYSRRMIKDEAIRNARAAGGELGAEHGIKGAEHGSNGGRPRTKTGEIKPPLKPPPSSSSSTSSSTSSSASAEETTNKEVERALRAAPKASRWPPNQPVPTDWITDGDIQRHNHDLVHIDLALEAVKFANYWAAKSGAAATKTDWHKTWINWALKAEAPRNNGKISAHDKGTQGAALFLARVEAGNGTGHRDGARTIGGGLSESGHGRQEVVGPVRDVLRGPARPIDRGDQGRLPTLSEEPGEPILPIAGTTARSV